MRNELEQIERIERYLQGEMSAVERSAFEVQMAADAGLREAVSLQREIMQGLERSVLTQQVQIAAKQFKLGKLYTKLFWGGVITAVVITAVVLYKRSQPHVAPSFGQSLPALNEAGEKEWADADRVIPAQVFTIAAGQDTVIETEKGIVFAIPARAFLDKDGKPVSGQISLTVKEALDATTIVQAGLSTTSGDQLLETGGMFLLDARQGENILKIDPANAVYAEIPADTIKPGMQLYKGQRKPDGSIDWVNPQTLEHDLVPVDIMQLDFYPPNYIDSLASWGHDVRNKKFTDSLYYSFAQLFQRHYHEYPYQREQPAPATFDEKSVETDSDENIIQAKYQAVDSAVSDTGAYDEYSEIGCGINPAKIKAIWSNKYQNTSLATRAFAERLILIHTLGNNEILDLYINNLDKPLWYVDSLIVYSGEGMARFSDKFIRFLERRDGKVQISSHQAQKLKQYYIRKTKAYTEAIAKTAEAFRKKQTALDQVAAGKKTTYQKDSLQQTMQNFQDELTLNLKEAYRQLGYNLKITRVETPPLVYSTQITTTGWNNIDRAVVESTLSRTTLDFTDSSTGKKAVIEYRALTIQIDHADTYDRTYVYLIPDQLSSFMRIKEDRGDYTEKMNVLMAHGLVCIGWKGEQAYYYRNDNINPGPHAPVSLTSINKNELERQLKEMGSRQQAKDMIKEQVYRQFEWQDRKRQQWVDDLYELRRNTGHVIFPCAWGYFTTN